MAHSSAYPPFLNLYVARMQRAELLLHHEKRVRWRRCRRVAIPRRFALLQDSGQSPCDRGSVFSLPSRQFLFLSGALSCTHSSLHLPTISRDKSSTP